MFGDEEHSLMKSMNFYNYSNNNLWANNSNLLKPLGNNFLTSNFSPFNHHNGNFDTNSNIGPIGVTQLIQSKIGGMGSGNKESLLGGIFPKV